MSNILVQVYEAVTNFNPVHVLAVVGGAALGGLGLPWLVQMAVRGWTGQQVPRWVMMTLRVGIAGLSGWLVMALLIHNGSGNGNGDGNGNGNGNGNNSTNTQPVAQPTKPKDEPQAPPADFTQDVTTLYVEVLGTETVNKIDSKITDPGRCYRVHTPDGPRLLTLKEVQDYLKQRVTEKPPLKNLTIVLYKDSPSRDVTKVRELVNAASVLSVAGSDMRLSVGYLEPAKPAPL